MNVGHLEAAKRGGGQQAATFRRTGGFDEILHPAFGGVLAQCLRQDRGVAPRHDRFDLALHHAHQDGPGQFSGFVLIHVRIGLVSGDDVAVAHHALGDVGVQVQRHRDRRARRDGADFLEQRAFAIVGAVRHHHGAVQVEQYGIATLGHLVANCVADAVIGVAVHRTARIRPGGDRSGHLGAELLGEIQERRHGHAFALHRLEGIATEVRTLRPELLPRCWHRREGVGLVLHLGNDEFHFLMNSS